MATRVVTGTILKASGAPLSGAVVKFRLVDDTYTLSPDASYPITTIPVVTATDGTFSVTLAAGLSVAYEVTTPDGEVFFIYVPEGSATTLEALRFAYDGVAVIPPPDLQAYVESALEGAAAQEIIEDYLGAAVQDSATIDATYTDGSGQLTLDVKPNTTQQKIAVRKGNSGSAIGTRQRLNFNEGSNVTLTIADDSANDEVDITIAASGGSTIAVKEANSNVVAAASSIDFTGADFNVTDGGSGRAVIALAGTLGGSIELKEDNAQVIAAMTALDFDGTHFNVANSGSGRGTITLANPGGSGAGSGVTTLTHVIGLGDGVASSGVVLQTGTRNFIRLPWNATIVGWAVQADVTSTVTLDVWKASGAVPANANSITDSAKPGLTAAKNAYSTTLTGWTTSITAGDIIGWEVEANDNAHTIDLQIYVERTMLLNYTNEDAQDAVGAMVANSTGINLTYVDATPSLTASPNFAGSGGDHGSSGLLARQDHLHDGRYPLIAHNQAASTITDFAEAAMDVVDALIVDSATIDKTYTDGSDTMSFAVISDTSTQRVLVNKAGGTAVGPRREINFVEGSGMTVTVADDPANNRINITLSSSGGGGGGGSLDVKEGNSGVVAAATAIDFDASDFNIADAGGGRATISLNYGTAADTPAAGDHVHPTAAGAITDFVEAVQDVVGNVLFSIDSTSIDFTYDDASNTYTATVKYAGSGTGYPHYGTADTAARSDHNHLLDDIVGALEFIQDAINSTIVAGTGITKSYNDALGQYTLSVDFTAVAALSHTHVAANITDLATVVDERARDAAGTALVNGSTTSITFTQNDGADTISGAVNFAGSGSAGTAARSDHTHTVTKSLNFPFGDEDGLGSVVATTARRTISIPVGWGTCTITRWRVLLDQSSTTTFDIWKDSYSNYPPTNADSITASAKPATSATTKNESTSLTGWTTTFTGGDVLTVEIEANSAAKWALLTVEFTMTDV